MQRFEGRAEERAAHIFFGPKRIVAFAGSSVVVNPASEVSDSLT
jgi:hypothetical protein